MTHDHAAYRRLALAVIGDGVKAWRSLNVTEHHQGDQFLFRAIGAPVLEFWCLVAGISVRRVRKALEPQPEQLRKPWETRPVADTADGRWIVKMPLAPHPGGRTGHSSLRGGESQVKKGNKGKSGGKKGPKAGC